MTTRYLTEEDAIKMGCVYAGVPDATPKLLGKCIIHGGVLDRYEVINKNGVVAEFAVGPFREDYWELWLIHDHGFCQRT